MMRGLFDLIGKHKLAAILVVLVIFVECCGAIYLYSIVFPGQAQPTATPTALVTVTPEPTPEPTSTPTPTPLPTPIPSPTVTPDLAMARSITPPDQYALKYMVQVDRSMDMGLLSVDLTKSDTGGEYAYRNDTYTTCLGLVDTANVPVDRIRIRATCVNYSGTGYTLYQDERVDSVLLKPGDVVQRTIGFKVASDAPHGLYTLRIEIAADLAGNGTWLDLGCNYESGLNILTADQ